MEEVQLSFWAKHKGYRLGCKNDTAYITPTDVENRWSYNPVKRENEILCDALNLGKLLTENSDHNAVIRQFVDKYGLLGILPDITSTTIHQYDQLVINENIFIPHCVIDTKDFVQYFFPYEEVSVAENKKYNIAFQGRDVIYTKMFMSEYHYSEPLMWIEKYMKYLYSSMNGDIDSLLQFNKPRLTYKIDIDNNEQPCLVCEYASLKAVIDFAFAKAITDERKPLRYCKHCGTIFYAKDVRSEFCSPRCRNQFNVYKYRAKS